MAEQYRPSGALRGRSDLPCSLPRPPPPDDETSNAGATLARYAADGVVLTAIRGEMGGLGVGAVVIKRKELGAVLEQELRDVLKHRGRGTAAPSASRSPQTI
jgi:hypothetical protein